MEKFCRRRNALISFAAWSVIVPMAGAQANDSFKAPPLDLSGVDLSALGRVQYVVPQQSGAITILPLNSPPINGFIPTVILGLTNEHNKNDFNGTSVISSSPGGTSLGNGTPYFSLATLDTGAQSHIISFNDPFYDYIDQANRTGDNSSEIQGANGTETVDITDGLGVYITGLGNATASPGGTISVTGGSLKGQTNTAVLTSEEGSALTNIVGAPMVAQWQAVIRNSQPQHITIGTQTTVSPNVSLQPRTTAFPTGYYKVPTTLIGAPATDPQFVSSVENFSDLSDNPLIPSFWGSMEAKVDVSHTVASKTDLNFLFDTGAQVTVVSEETAGNIGFFTSGPHPSTPDFYVAVAGVGGEVDQVPGFYMNSLSLHTTGGALNWTHVPVLVLNLPDPSGTGYLPGVFGTNLLTDRDIVVNGANGGWVGISDQWMWANDTAGNFGDSTKWTLALPSGPDTQANFFGAITQPRTITVASNVTVGSVAFDNTNRYTLNGPGRITLNVSVDHAKLNVSTGSHTINAPMTFLNDTDVTTSLPTSMLTITSDVIATGVAINKEGPGILEMKNVRAGALNVNGGTMFITANGTTAGASTVGALTIAGGASPVAKLDLMNNALAIDYTGTSPAVDVRAWLASGFAGGSWNGNGIISSQAAAIGANPANIHKTAIGYAQASALGNPGTFFGQPVDGTSLLMRYTLSGDANLDGIVNAQDFTALAIGFNGQGIDGAGEFWQQGDFNYDGVVNAMDFNSLATNFGQVLASPPLGSLVPEPTSLLSLVAMISSTRRSRKFQ